MQHILHIWVGELHSGDAGQYFKGEVLSSLFWLHVQVPIPSAPIPCGRVPGVDGFNGGTPLVLSIKWLDAEVDHTVCVGWMFG